MPPVQGTANFEGVFSAELDDEGRTGRRIQRSGFAGISSEARLRLRAASCAAPGVTALSGSCGSVWRFEFVCALHQTALSLARGVQEGDYLDLEERDVLVLRVRGDGRKYLVSLRTDNWVVGAKSHDVWQAFLFAPCGPSLRARRVRARESAPRLRSVLHGRGHTGVRTGHAGFGVGSACGPVPKQVP